MIAAWLKRISRIIERASKEHGLIPVKTKPVLKITARVYRAAEDKWYDIGELK